MATAAPTAGIIVIGNEILSGKVQDSNAPFLTRELRALGVELRRIVTVPDDLDDIAAAVREFRVRFDINFTSGGVGPTHDDVTMEGIARGLERRVIRHPAIEATLRGFYKDRINAARLRLADVPEGTELIVDGRLGFPTIKCENFYILPGIPELFEQKFHSLRDRFASAPYHLRVVYTRDGEGTIAEHLNATLAAFPQLLLGSYPRMDDTEYAVKLTLESKDRDYVERAFHHLIGLLPAEGIVRTE
ncbi:MAG: competence/damage-inducible protein A [Candidatus Binatia bacterium]